MRTRIVFGTLIASTILFFTACEQDSLLETVDALPEDTIETNTEVLEPTNLEAAIDISSKFETDTITGEIESRSPILIYSNTHAVSSSDWHGHWINASSLWNERYYKYIVKITALSGNPDLYFYGYDSASSDNFRQIRGANRGYIEINTFRKSDLKNYGRSEEKMYIGVWGKSAATFKLEIWRTTVECEEYPTADQITTLEYAPVCGCDGNEYPNASTAFVSGITSWTNGPCQAACDCGTGFGTVDICDDFESYTTAAGLSTQAPHWRKWSPSSLEPDIFRALGGGPGVGGFTITEMAIQRKAGSAQSDILLSVGNKSSGVHRFKWDMYVSNGKSAYFNIQRFTTPGAEFGEQFYFNRDGTVRIRYGNSYFYSFSYPQGRYFEIELIVDLNARRYTLAIDGHRVVSWTNNNGSRSVGAIDFYPADHYAFFKVDNVCFEKYLSASPYSTSNTGIKEVEAIEAEIKEASNFKDLQTR